MPFPRVWVFDINRRVYPPTKPGELRCGDSPIWRKHWVEHTVVGETKVSWVTSWGKKIPKKGADPQTYAFSEEEIDRAAFVHDHGWRITQRVAACRDYDLLQKVAAVVGYVPTT